MHRFGITSVIDPGLMPFEVSAYQAAYAQGNLSVRTNLMLSWHGFREEENEAELDARATSTGLMTGLGDVWLRLGGLKMAIDGGTSSHTAFMYAPFEGEATVGNFNRLDPAQLRRYFRTAQEHGWDVGIHTCGDRAMDMVVDAFSEVVSDLPNTTQLGQVIYTEYLLLFQLAGLVLLVAMIGFPLGLLRQLCRRGGLGEQHFEWSNSAIAQIRRNLPWLISLGMPLIFIASAIYSTDAEHRVDLSERLCFVAATLLLTELFRRILKPETGILSEYLAKRRGSWIDRLHVLWYWGGVSVPVALAGLTIAGFYYTAQQLAWRLYLTIVFALVTLLVREYLQRLLLIQRRRLSIEQAQERRAAMLAAQARQQAVEGTGSESVSRLNPEAIVPAPAQTSVAALSEQSRSLINAGFVFTALIGIWLIWVDVLPALRIMDQWPLWRTTVTIEVEEALPDGSSIMATREVVQSVTIADLALALLILSMTIACARNIPGLMEMWILQRLPLDNSVRYAITSLTSYLIVLLGIMLSFNAVSVGWSKVQWLATALTFGLGFGLQEIFANFVAGLILLFERPLRIGDVVTVDDVSGVVSRIRIRATTITNWDRKEYVIPNKEFITGRMLNWTLSDKTNRVVINVGIAYGSNVELARSLMLKVCREHPLTLEEPPASVTFEGFGDNTLNFVIRTFLPDLDNRLAVIDALHTTIDREFRANGIEISFPQRDLHLRSIDQSVIEGLRGPGAAHSEPSDQ